ncbi:IS66 family transposase [Rhodoplanes elegans]|nr:transposase [Rhodoplanes elegans]
MLDRGNEKLSIRRQCALLGVARSSVYRPERPANDNDLALMRRIDELSTTWARFGELSSGSGQANAVKYALGHWDGLVRFLADGRLEPDTNIAKHTATSRCVWSHPSVLDAIRFGTRR